MHQENSMNKAMATALYAEYVDSQVSQILNYDDWRDHTGLSQEEYEQYVDSRINRIFKFDDWLSHTT